MTSLLLGKRASCGSRRGVIVACEYGGNAHYATFQILLLLDNGSLVNTCSSSVTVEGELSERL